MTEKFEYSFLVIVYEKTWTRSLRRMNPTQLRNHYKGKSAHILNNTNITQCEKFCSYGLNREKESTFKCKFFLSFDSNGDGLKDTCILHPPTTLSLHQFAPHQNEIYLKMELNINYTTLKEILRNPKISFCE